MGSMISSSPPENPSQSMPDWGDLPTEILLQISSHLAVPDLLRFSAVCSLWRSVAGEARRLSPTPHRQPPWLMIPSPASDEATADFLPVSAAAGGGGKYAIAFPEPPVYRRLCIGAGHGWVVTASNTGRIHLLNPVNGAQIQLPPIGSFNEMIIKRISRQELRYPKATLSSNPCDGCYTVVLLDYIPELSLAFIRSGEENWTIIPGLTNCTEMVYHNGLLYTATREGVLRAWDLNGPSPPKSMVVLPDQRLYSWRFRSLMYLASSSWGDLLQVWWEMKSVGLFLKVYKVDFERKKLIQMESLGDHALFLGGNHSICLSSVDVPEVRGNCIYFSDDCFDLPRSSDHEHLGIYNLEDGIFEAIFPIDIRSSWQRPIWIRPSLSYRDTKGRHLVAHMVYLCLAASMYRNI